MKVKPVWIIVPIIMALLFGSTGCVINICEAEEESTNPLIVGDLACFFHRPGNDARYLTVLNIDTWETAWRIKVADGRDLGPWHAAGKLYITTEYSKIQSYDLINGSRIESVSVPDNQQILIASGGSIFAWDHSKDPILVYTESLEITGRHLVSCDIQAARKWRQGALFVLADSSIVYLFVERGEVKTETLYLPVAGEITEDDVLRATILVEEGVLFCYKTKLRLFDLERRKLLKSIPLTSLCTFDVSARDDEPLTEMKVKGWNILHEYIGPMRFAFKMGSVFCYELSGSAARHWSTFPYYWRGVELREGTAEDGTILWTKKTVELGTYEAKRNICIAGIPESRGALDVWNVATGEVIRIVSHRDLQKVATKTMIHVR